MKGFQGVPIQVACSKLKTLTVRVMLYPNVCYKSPLQQEFYIHAPPAPPLLLLSLALTFPNLFWIPQALGFQAIFHIFELSKHKLSFPFFPFPASSLCYSHSKIFFYLPFKSFSGSNTPKAEPKISTKKIDRKWKQKRLSCKF